MWQKLNRQRFNGQRKSITFVLAGLGLIALFLAGCGGAMSSAGTSNSTASNGAPTGLDIQHSASKPQVQSTPAVQQNSSKQSGPQYLVKNLQVTMEVQNPMQSASDLQQWVAFTDPQSTSDGTDYESAGNGQYTVTLTFLVDIAHYDQVKDYLRGYAVLKGHTLDSLKETVQDVTNDYVDTESTLANLRAEQQRLLSFMNQAQNVNDAVSIEQQLTQVEGQINQIEAHLNALKGQTAFYPVTVIVQPVGSAPPPPPPPSPWSVIPVWQGAWSGVVAVWQVLISVLVWLFAFSVYLIPIGILVWLIRKRPWRRSLLPPLKPALAPVSAPVTAGPSVELTAPPRPLAVPPDTEPE